MKSQLRLLSRWGVYIAAVFVVAITVVFALPRLQAVRWSRADVQLARQRAEVIIAALNEYREENSSYPKAIYLLVPDYLTRIPETGKKGRDWRYILKESQYTLSFGGEDPPEAYNEFNSERQTWFECAWVLDS